VKWLAFFAAPRVKAERATRAYLYKGSLPLLSRWMALVESRGGAYKRRGRLPSLWPARQISRFRLTPLSRPAGVHPGFCIDNRAGQT